MNSPNPYAPPQAKVVDIVEDSDDFVLANACIRLGAYVIDTILSTLVTIVGVVAVWLSVDDESGPGAGIAWLIFLVSAGVLIWFNVLYVLQNGQSVAKRWLGIKVVRSDGDVQATLGGWPLYVFIKDKKPGDVFGEGVKGTWHVLNPAGKRAVK